MTFGYIVQSNKNKSYIYTQIIYITITSSFIFYIKGGFPHTIITTATIIAYEE
jgi:hypothetical protein